MTETERFASMMTSGAALRTRIAGEMAGQVLAVVDVCERAIRAGGKLMFAGNGGSAGDSMHLATEMLIRLRPHVERASWPALALMLDPTMVLAAGNDYGFDQVFARPLSGLGRRGDVFFGITTSGKSANVVAALAVARDMGITTVGLLGGTGGPALALCDHALVVPSTETARIQECHIALGHAIMELLEDRMIAAG